MKLCLKELKSLVTKNKNSIPNDLGEKFEEITKMMVHSNKI